MLLPPNPWFLTPRHCRPLSIVSTMTDPASLLDLIGQYPVLATLSSYLSTIDLLHLGLAARRAHALILGSPEVFEVLKRQCLCDGRGLPTLSR